MVHCSFYTDACSALLYSFTSQKEYTSSSSSQEAQITTDGSAPAAYTNIITEAPCLSYIPRPIPADQVVRLLCTYYPAEGKSYHINSNRLYSSPAERGKLLAFDDDGDASTTHDRLLPVHSFDVALLVLVN